MSRALDDAERCEKCGTAEFPLDEIWYRVSPYFDRNDDYLARAQAGARSALIDEILAIIESLGGMDPLQRGLDPRTPEYGVGA